MARFLTGSALAGIVVLLGGGAAASAQEQALKHREIRGPKGFPDKRSIFAHINEVVFTRDGTKMAAGVGATVTVWSVADGKELVRMQLPEQQIYHRLAFSEDGKTLLWSGREDPMVRTFDVTTGKQTREFREPNVQQRGEGFSSRFLAFSPDGKRIAFHGANYWGEVDVVDAASGKIVLNVQLGKQDCRSLAFSPDGKQFAVHSGNGGLWLWDAETGKQIREFTPDNRGGGAYKFVTFSPDGKFVTGGGHTANSLDVWNVATGKLLCSVPTKTYFYSVSFAPDGQSIVCTEADGRPYLYHLIAEKAIYRFDPPDRNAHFVRFTPDGKRVAIIGYATDPPQDARQESIYLYEIPTELLNPPAAQVDDAALEQLWGELSTDNELKLQRVLTALRGAPGPTVALVAKKVPPVAQEEQAKVEKWIAQLDDDAFAKRDEALKVLSEAAHRFAPLLKAKKEAAGAGGIRNRLTFVLREMEGEALPAALVKEARAVALLEQIATAEARKLLAQLAEGAAGARLTAEARAALERMPKEKAPGK